MVKRILADSSGRIVIFQLPNLPIWGWLIFKLAARMSNDQRLVESFTALSTISLLIWATLEITTGVNYFRQLLGVVVLVATLANYV